MNPRDTAHAIPGCLGWIGIAAIFLATGEWIDSIEKAGHHPWLLGLVALSLVLSSIWRTSGWSPSVWNIPRALVINLLGAAFILGVVLAVSRIHLVQFTAFGRPFGLGTAVLTA